MRSAFVMVMSPVLRGDARVPFPPARVGVRAGNRVRMRERRRAACTRGRVGEANDARQAGTDDRL
ncbi:hypothetical protein, partial [Burkholderia cenocepacia]|uniref:hypothetical protein n=1 Tax=Burkholderia cenocepacia TaxID=95486 RepID=UPI0006694031